ncbi:MAG: hypothetical protein ACRDZM_03170 [Acidimicrobiia bacterium]
MKSKDVLYAAVGAPVVAARKVGDKVDDLRAKLSDGKTGYGKSAGKAINEWAIEGEKLVSRITDGKVVDEITSKVDLDQAREQVGKLRDQLEEMLATWRTSFRPETTEHTAEVTETTGPTATAPSRKPAPPKPATKSGTTKASAAKTTKSSAAKTSPTKPTSAQSEKAS